MVFSLSFMNNPVPTSAFFELNEFKHFQRNVSFTTKNAMLTAAAFVTKTSNKN